MGFADLKSCVKKLLGGVDWIPVTVLSGQLSTEQLFFMSHDFLTN